MNNNKSQWIEIQNNSGASILTGDKTHKPLMFYGPNETPPAKTAAVAATATAAAVPAALPAGVTDRIGTIDALGWRTGRSQVKVRVVERVLAKRRVI